MCYFGKLLYIVAEAPEIMSDTNMLLKSVQMLRKYDDRLNYTVYNMPKDSPENPSPQF